MAGRPYSVWPNGRPIQRSGAVWELGKCTQWVVSRHVRPSSRKSEAGVTRHNQTKVGHSFFDVGFWGWNGPARLPLRTSATSQKRTFSCDGRPKKSPARGGAEFKSQSLRKRMPSGWHILTDTGKQRDHGRSMPHKPGPCLRPKPGRLRAVHRCCAIGC